MGDNHDITTDRGRGKKEEEDIKTTKERGKNEHTQEKDTTKEGEDTGKNDTPINWGINSPINPNNWQDVLSSIDPSRTFLTKENYEVITSILNTYEYAIIHNIYDFIKNASVSRCFHERVLKFITISKIGASLSAFKQIRLNALIEAIKQQSNMYNQALNVLSTIASSFANAYILREYVSITPPVTDLQITHIAIDIKVASIITTAIGAIVAIGTEIGNLKNDIRTQIAIDEYCLTACSPACTSSPFPAREEGKEGGKAIDMEVMDISKIREAFTFNEGEVLKQYADKALSWLERLVELEFSVVKDQLNKNIELPKPQ